MDHEKQVPVTETAPPEKPGITAGVTGLIGATVSSIAESVKDVASAITAHIKNPTISNRVETAHPPVEENFDAPPMTAEDIAELAAAETQPVSVARKAKRREAAAVKRAAPKPTANASAAKTPAKKAKKATVAAAKNAKQAKKSAKTVAKKLAQTPARKLKTAEKKTTRKAAKKTKTRRRTVKRKTKAKRG
jgi:colicin import membrane protein